MNFTDEDDKKLVDYISKHKIKGKSIRQHQMWSEISRILDKPVIQCRLRWKNIRDFYIRKLKANNFSIDIKPPPRNCQYWDKLKFLDPSIVDEKRCLTDVKEEKDENACKMAKLPTYDKEHGRSDIVTNSFTSPVTRPRTRNCNIKKEEDKQLKNEETETTDDFEHAKSDIIANSFTSPIARPRTRHAYLKKEGNEEMYEVPETSPDDIEPTNTDILSINTLANSLTSPMTRSWAKTTSSKSQNSSSKRVRFREEAEYFEEKDEEMDQNENAQLLGSSGDDVELFFKAMAATVKKFPAHVIPKVKAQVFSVVCNMEMSLCE